MARVDTNINKALLDRVASLVLTNPLPVSWPNKAFPGKTALDVEIPMPPSYIEVDIQAHQNERMFLDGADPFWRTGFLQLMLVTPFDRGHDEPMEVAGEIADYFPADLKLVSENVVVKVSGAPDIARGYQTGISWNIPITVNYEVSA